MSDTASPRRHGRPPGLRRVAVVVALASGLTALGGPGRAAAQVVGPPERLGDVVVVDASDFDREITHADSTSEFGLRLPPGAACPGDSMHDDWRVQSWIVPADVDPADLVFDDVGPVGQDQWALFGTNTNQYVDVLTLANGEPGQPGLIQSVTPLSFAVFPPDVLPRGDYRIGVSCTWFERVAASWWDTTIVVSDDPDDEARFLWRVASAPVAPPDEGGAGAGLVVAAGAVAVAVAGAAFLAVRASSRGRAATNVPKSTHAVAPSPSRRTTRSEEMS